MKTRIALLALMSLAGLAPAAEPPKAPAPPTQPPPPVAIAPGQPAAPGKETYTYDQKPLAGRAALVDLKQAETIISRFKAAYPKLGSPRMLIYVNRELVDEENGLKLAARTERTEASRSRIKGEFTADPNAPKPEAASKDSKNSPDRSATAHTTPTPGKGEVSGKSQTVVNENRYQNKERAQAALADKQTVRDIERLFGRPLRMAGVRLADQRVATQLIADQPLKHFTVVTEGEAARKDREALAKITDVVIEILISSRNVTVAGVAGDATYAAPDIQATAIRLSDAQILSQAAASDVIGKERYSAYVLRNFDVHDVAEATALALMEDLTAGPGEPEPAKK